MESRPEGPRIRRAIDAYEAQQQAQLEQDYPDKDVLYVIGPYIAVPKGTEVVSAMSLPRLREKLADPGGT